MFNGPSALVQFKSRLFSVRVCGKFGTGCAPAVTCRIRVRNNRDYEEYFHLGRNPMLYGSSPTFFRNVGAFQQTTWRYIRGDNILLVTAYGNPYTHKKRFIAY